jgi:excisionase family DNA binding protein
VSSIRRVNGIDAYLSADKTSEWRTMTEAARELNVTNHTIRRLIKEQILPARQLVRGAPYQIRLSDLQREAVQAALKCKNAPCRMELQNQLPMFTDP